ncbi:integrase core domain-containing protein [Formosa sp. 4Alg 33]
MQNGYIERFNRHYREDILDAYYFDDIYQLQKLNNQWKLDYNNNHPHKSLGNKSPVEFMPRFEDEINLIPKSEQENNFLSNLEVS